MFYINYKNIHNEKNRGKPTMWFHNTSVTNRPVQAQKTHRSLKFQTEEEEGFTFRVAKTKALISFAVTAKLICAFVFAYADCLFSHEAAHFFELYVLRNVD